MIYVGDFLRELRRRRAALLHRRRRAGEPGHRLHLGRVRPPQQLRAGQRVGQPGQPVDLDGAQERRRDPGGRRARPTPTPSCSRLPGRRSTRSASSSARNRFKQAVGEAMRVVAAANRYLSDQEPWKRKDDPDRRDTILHTALQVVQDANTLLTPFLPHAAQQVHEALGGTGVWAAQPEIEEVDDLGDGPGLPRPHRRLHRRAGAVGVHADRGRPPAGPAHADLHQARPGARRDRPGVGADRAVTGPLTTRARRRCGGPAPGARRAGWGAGEAAAAPPEPLPRPRWTPTRTSTPAARTTPPSVGRGDGPGAPRWG